MTQEPEFAEVNPALREATGQVLQLLGLSGEDFADLITLDQLYRLATTKEAALPGQPPWDYAYGAASEILYQACHNPASPGHAAAYRCLRHYFYGWFRLKLGGDELAAEDLAGDVMVIIVRKLDTVRFPTAFLAWCQQIARNRLKEHFSKKEKDESVTGLVTAPADPAQSLETVRTWLRINGEEVEDTSPGANPESVILDRELRAHLLDCIGQMRSNTKNSRFYKQILVGFYFENMSIGELARRLGLTTTKVTKFKNQALLNLRKILEKSGEDSNI